MTQTAMPLLVPVFSFFVLFFFGLLRQTCEQRKTRLPLWLWTCCLPQKPAGALSQHKCMAVAVFVLLVVHRERSLDYLLSTLSGLYSTLLGQVMNSHDKWS